MSFPSLRAHCADHWVVKVFGSPTRRGLGGDAVLFCLESVRAV
jgi:hypothetical protein